MQTISHTNFTQKREVTPLIQSTHEIRIKLPCNRKLSYLITPHCFPSPGDEKSGLHEKKKFTPRKKIKKNKKNHRIFSQVRGAVKSGEIFIENLHCLLAIQVRWRLQVCSEVHVQLREN